MANKNFEVKHGLSVGGTERITSAGVGAFPSLSTSGNLSVGGNLIVTGSTTTADNLASADKNITLNYHASNDTSSSADGAGITIQDAVDASNNATLLWNAAGDNFTFSHNVGVGISQASDALDVRGSGSDTFIRVGHAAAAGNDSARIGKKASTHDMEIHTSAGTTASKLVNYRNSSGSVNFVVDTSGRLLLGDHALSAGSQSVGGAEARLQIHGNNATRSQFHIGRFTSNAAGPQINFLKSRNSTPGSNTIVQDDDRIGRIRWCADDGTDYASEIAEIRAEIDGTPGADDTPGRLIFKTTADGANSSSNRMTITSAGNVGIGTSSPATELQVGDYTDNLEQITIATASDQTGRINFYNNNSTEGASIRVIGGGNGAKMYFANRYDTDTDRVTIDLVNGYLGVGITSPQNTLHVHTGSTDSRLQFTNGSSGSAYADGLWVGHDNTQAYFMHRENLPITLWTNATERMRITSNGRQAYNSSGTANAHATFVGEVGNSSRALAFEHTVGGGEVGTITTSSSATNYGSGSDYRLKEHVNYTWDATHRLKQLKPIQFQWIADDSGSSVDGFLAHEVSPIVPEAVKGEKDAIFSGDDVANGDGKNVGDPIYQQIDHGKLVPLLVKTIQELEARIATLEG